MFKGACLWAPVLGLILLGVLIGGCGGGSGGAGISGQTSGGGGTGHVASGRVSLETARTVAANHVRADKAARRLQALYGSHFLRMGDDFLGEPRILKGGTGEGSQPRGESAQEDLAYVFPLQPRGYIVVPTLRELPPILAYSYDSDFSWQEDPGNHLLCLLRVDLGSRRRALAAGALDGREIDKNHRAWSDHLAQDGVAEPAAASGHHEQVPPASEARVAGASGPGPGGGKAVALRTGGQRGRPSRGARQLGEVESASRGAGAGPAGTQGAMTAPRAADDQVEEGAFPAEEPGDGHVFGPLITFKTWGQLGPYWDRCPRYMEQPTVVGCVATAMGQLMNYWEYPTSHTFVGSYKTRSLGIKVTGASASFSGLDYNHGNPSDAVKAIVSFAAGYSVRMNYNTSSSGTQVAEVGPALAEFGYPRPTVSRGWSASQAIDQIQNSWPFAIAIDDANLKGGHAILVDGYDSGQEVFHLNWCDGETWGSDGWYSMPSGMPQGYCVVLDTVTNIRSPLVPKAPLRLTGTVTSPTQNDLSWTDASADETGFRIERRAGDGDFLEVSTVDADVTTYRDSGLTPGTQYTYRVRACNAVGTSASSNEATALSGGFLESPSDVYVWWNSNRTMLNVGWEDNSDTETGYTIQRKVGDGPFEEVGRKYWDNTWFYEDDPGLDAVLVYRVLTRGIPGTSTPSEEVCMPPVEPDGLRAVRPSLNPTTTINLFWDDRSCNETDFYIYQQTSESGPFVLIGKAPRNATACGIPGLEPATRYAFKMRAIHSSGFSAYSTTAVAYTAALPSVPYAPADLKARAVSQTQADLTWRPQNQDHTGFVIERREGPYTYDDVTNWGVGCSFEEVARVGANVTSYSDVGLSGETTYIWRVRAFNDNGNSGYSELASLTLPGLPTPTALTALLVSPTQVNLTWTDASSSESGFRIERRAGDGPFEEVATVGADVTAFADSGLTQGLVYTYRVRALSEGGDSSYSFGASVALDDAFEDNDKMSEAKELASGSPVTLYCQDYDYFKVWCNPGETLKVEASFRHAQGDLGMALYGPDSKWIATSEGQTDGECIVHPTTQQGYYYVLVFPPRYAENQYSLQVRRLPRDPSGLTAALESSTEVNLAWSDNASNETGYRVERKTGFGPFVEIGSVGADVTAYADADLTPGVAYAWRVMACNSEGVSGYSNEASATPLAGGLVAPGDLTATLTGGRALLRWSDNSPNETGFRVQRRVGEGEFAPLLDVGAAATTCLDPGPVSGQAYTYRVLAFNPETCSNWSNQALARPADSTLVLGLGERGKGSLESFDRLGDGELVHASWPGVRWPAYGNAPLACTYPAAGDVDGDGLDELVVGLDAPGQGWVCVLDDSAANHALLGWLQVTWGAYTGSGNAPTYPACADLDGDGTDEIAVGLGSNGQGWAQVFQSVGGGRFQPFPAQGGWVQVQSAAYSTSGDAPTLPAGGDFNGDGRDELVLGLGSKGQGWVQVFTYEGGALVPYTATAPFSDRGWVPIGWHAYATSGDAPVHPAAADLDQDGKADLALGLGGAGGGWIRFYRSTGTGFQPMDGTPIAGGWFQVPWAAYNESPGASTWPACGDLNADGTADVVVGLGAAGQGWVYALLGGTFAPVQAADFEGWLQVRWDEYVSGPAPTRPAILDRRVGPSASLMRQVACLNPGGPVRNRAPGLAGLLAEFPFGWRQVFGLRRQS